MSVNYVSRSLRLQIAKTLVMPAAALTLAGWLLVGGGVSPTRADDGEPETKIKDAQVFFVKSVKPILETSCVGCHGDQRAKAGLNMTTRDRLLKGGRSGPVIDLKHPEKSPLLVAIGYKDQDLRMPPRMPLKEEQVEAIKQWVAAGVPWPDGVVLTPAPRGRK